MLARRLDELLAQTDPFDLAQALERRVASLSSAQIHGLIHDALPRMNEYYAQEFSRVNAADDEASLRSAFAQTLKSNLRVVPVFGNAFGESVLALTPSERAVGFSEEPQRQRARWAAGAVVAAALAAAALAGGHYVTQARIQAATATAEPMAVALPQTARPSLNTTSHTATPRRRPPAHRATPAPPPSTVPPPPAAAVAAVQQPAHAPAQSAPVPTPRNRPRPAHSAAPPVAHGEAVVAVPQPKQHEVDTVQSNGIDTSDMPQPYTDATPMPGETPAAVSEPHGSRVNTPTPAPRRGGWLHRTIMHLDPFKPHPQETP